MSEIDIDKDREILNILTDCAESGCSDIFIIPGSNIKTKLNGKFQDFTVEPLNPHACSSYIRWIYNLADRKMGDFMNRGEDDFSFTISGIARFRCSAYKQRGTLAAVIRVVKFGLPDYTELHIPKEVVDLYKEKDGMVLITGPAGSGKSTTLACIVDQINETKEGHIITLEDPIEFLHKHKKSLVSQREISQDSLSYLSALRSALRQTPNGILLGEMRDIETTHTALLAAETGQLLLSTLHTIGAAKTIDRIIDIFPAEQQQQVRVQLSIVLKAVVSQQLIPTIDGKMIPAIEFMRVNPAIRTLIRDGKTHQIQNVITSTQGMWTMDSYLLDLYKSGNIDKDAAMNYCVNQDFMHRALNGA